MELEFPKLEVRNYLFLNALKLPFAETMELFCHKNNK